MQRPELQRYFKIYVACHTCHLRDDETGRSLSTRLGSILDHLDVNPSLTLSTLAKHLEVTESTPSIQIGKLESAGYARRIRDSHGRRLITVGLATAGKVG